MCPEQDSNVRTGQIPFAQQGELAQCTLCRSANDLLPSLAQSLGEMIDNRRLSKADCLNVGIPLLELASGETGTRPTYRTGAALVCRPRLCRNSCLVVGLWALSRPSLALCRRSQVDPLPTNIPNANVTVTTLALRILFRLADRRIAVARNRLMHGMVRCGMPGASL